MEGYSFQDKRKGFTRYSAARLNNKISSLSGKSSELGFHTSARHPFIEYIGVSSFPVFSEGRLTLIILLFPFTSGKEF